MFGDMWRLAKAGIEAKKNDPYTLGDKLRLSADAAEAWTAMNAGATPAQGAAAPAPGAGVPWSPGAFGGAGANPFANLAFMQTGLAAAGTVVSIADTGRQASGASVYLVLLELKIDGREPYQANYETVIAAAALSNWRPGRVLDFRVSPDDPYSLMLG